MADLDEEFARFQAELASLEETTSETKEETPSDSKKRPRDEESALKADETQPNAKRPAPAPVVIAAKPKIYSAPPRPAPERREAYDLNTDVAADGPDSDALAGGAYTGGALSGFPMGTTGEYAATAGTVATAKPQMPVQRVDMVTGEYLSLEEQSLMNQQQSVYEYNPQKAARAFAGTGADGPNGKSKRNLRMAGGQIWEDQTLADWPDNDFRLFIGDLGNEVSDEILAHAFSRYPSFQRSRVVRDKHTHKTKGFGFVSFGDPFDCAKALREMNGKYIGNRPVKIQKSKWHERNIEVARKKAKNKKKMHLF